MPAYAENVKTVTREALADHTGDQHKFVVASGGRGFALAGAGVKALGVLLNKPANKASNTGALSTNSGFSDGAGGTIALIEAGGTAPVVSGAAITAGAAVMSNASGLAVTATSTNAILGYAEEAATGAGELIAVALVDGGTAA